MYTFDYYWQQHIDILMKDIFSLQFEFDEATGVFEEWFFIIQEIICNIYSWKSL